MLTAAIVTAVIFVPTFFLTGMSRFLFEPLAKSVTFAITGSFLVAMTLIPLMASRFLAVATHAKEPAFAADRRFNRVRDFYRTNLARALRGRHLFLGAVLVLFLASWGLFRLIGRENPRWFTPRDSGTS